MMEDVSVAAGPLNVSGEVRPEMEGIPEMAGDDAQRSMKRRAARSVGNYDDGENEDSRPLKKRNVLGYEVPTTEKHRIQMGPIKGNRHFAILLGIDHNLSNRETWAHLKEDQRIFVRNLVNNILSLKLGETPIELRGEMQHHMKMIVGYIEAILENEVFPAEKAVTYAKLIGDIARHDHSVEEKKMIVSDLYTSLSRGKEAVNQKRLRVDGLRAELDRIERANLEISGKAEQLHISTYPSEDLATSSYDHIIADEGLLSGMEANTELMRISKSLSLNMTKLQDTTFVDHMKHISSNVEHFLSTLNDCIDMDLTHPISHDT